MYIEESNNNNDDDDDDVQDVQDLFFKSITKEKCDDLLQDDYTIIDNFLGLDYSTKLLHELKDLTLTGKMIPNRTLFVNSKTGKPSIIAKPGIFEVDLHDESIRLTMKHMNKLFIASRTSLIEILMKYVNETMTLISGNNGRTLKLQWNKGTGGCFPYHYENPGSPNNRALTCILYLNLNWKQDHGGELTLQPFLKQKIHIDPIFDRLVIFKSNLILHRVEKAFHERYCITFWLDGDSTNSPENSELKLPKTAIEDIESSVKFLHKSATQRALSRFVYKEEYEESIYDCMENASGCEEMIESHLLHCKSLESNQLLRNLIEALRAWRFANDC
jgi:hypothetical protein